MKLAILGSPGSGKDTQTQQVAEYYNLKLIVVGNIIKKEVWSNSKIGKIMYDYTKDGKFVPNDIIVDVIKEEINNVANYDGFILNSAPINMEQLKLMQDIPLDAAILLDIRDYDIVRRRTMSRLICPNCMSVTNINESPDMICPVCSQKLQSRYDDNIDVVNARIEQFKRESVPVALEFEKVGKLIKIDAENDKKSVKAEIIEKLDNFFNKTT